MHKLLPPLAHRAQPPRIIKRVLKHLDNLSTNPSLLIQLDDFYQHSRNYTFSRKPFPPIPAPGEMPHLIEKYVENITSTTYAGKIFHTATRDSSTAALQEMMKEARLTPAAADLAIAHFARVGDPVSILSAMALVEPRRDHFNHWLYSLYNQRRFAPDSFRTSAALAIFAAMAEEKLAANGQTWNMALLAIPTRDGLLTLYAAMLERGIPLDKEAAHLVAKHLISTNGISRVAKELERAHAEAAEANLPLRQMVHALIAEMLKLPDANNANVRQAFDFMNFWAARGLQPTKSTLNIFLYQFSRRRHLDWMIGISEFFRQEYGVEMTSKSWEHMAHGASRLNDSPQKFKAVGMVFIEAIKLALTERAKHSFRAASTAAENSGQALLYPGQHVWPYLRNRLNWYHWSGPPDYTRDTAAAKAAALLGVGSEQPDIPLLGVPLEEIGINPQRLWGGTPP